MPMIISSEDDHKPYKEFDDKCRIFVGQIDRIVTEDQLREAFSKAGKITVLHYNPPPLSVRGWALITYETPEEATKAISIWHNKVLENCFYKLEVRIANPRYSKHYDGHSEPPSVHHLPNIIEPVQFIEVAWKQQFTDEGVPYYIDPVTGQTQWERPPQLGGVSPSVRFNNSFRPNPIIGPPGASLFVLRIPTEWSNEDLYTFFAPYGRILTARLLRNKAKTARVGFVSYDNVNSALFAIKAMHTNAMESDKNSDKSPKTYDISNIDINEFVHLDSE